MSHGAVSPLPRVVGPGSAEIGGVHVPQGVSIIAYFFFEMDTHERAQTTVSMSAASVHCNSDIFPNPKEFKPERWLQPSSRELENYLVAFSRGPRSCLGIKCVPQIQPWSKQMANISQSRMVRAVPHPREYLPEGGYGSIRYNVSSIVLLGFNLSRQQFDLSPDDFEYKSYFLPHYTGKHFRAKVRERTT